VRKVRLNKGSASVAAAAAVAVAAGGRLLISSSALIRRWAGSYTVKGTGRVEREMEAVYLVPDEAGGHYWVRDRRRSSGRRRVPVHSYTAGYMEKVIESS
jgi:hypothetical protein